MMIYMYSVRSKLVYASVVRNSITYTDANKLELIQQEFTVFFVLIVSFPISITVTLSPQSILNCTPYVRGDITLKHSCLLNVTVVLNSSFRFGNGLRVPARYIRDVMC
jgi:hypothetical protein